MYLYYILHRNYTDETIWYSAASVKDQGRLQWILHSAEKVIGWHLSSLHDLHTSRTLKWAGQFLLDPSHPACGLFGTFPSDRRLRSIRTKTSSHVNSFSFFPRTPNDSTPLQITLISGHYALFWTDVMCALELYSLQKHLTDVYFKPLYFCF